MALVDIILQITFYGCITAVVTAYLLYRRLATPSRTAVRVHYSGGTEKTFEAVEIGLEVVWIQERQEQRANIPLHYLPGHTTRWGVHYRVWDINDGDDEVLLVPWMRPQTIDPENPEQLITLAIPSDAAAKERYRRRMRFADSFQQIAAGLKSINRWQAVALILLGLFAGLWLSPIIAGAIG